MTDATTNKPVWAPATRKLYRAAMYWGCGKLAAWTLASAVHKRMEDAWITWAGGACPVPFGTLIDVAYRSGGYNYGVRAGVMNDTHGSDTTACASDWWSDGHPRDIVAYRLAVEDAWDYVSHDDLAHINKPFVDGGSLVLAAREQVPALLELGECDAWLLRQADVQSHALQLLGLLDEMYSYGMRRQRTSDGWQFYIKGGKA